MDEIDDINLKRVFESIEKSSETGNCPNCRKKINWKDTPHEDIPGILLPISFCNEFCKEQFINGQIKHHEDILRDLYKLKSGVMDCPNCGKEAVRFLLREVPFVNNTGEEFVGMAVHREIIGNDGEPIPECFCNLNAEDWRSLLGIGEK